MAIPFLRPGMSCMPLVGLASSDPATGAVSAVASALALLAAPALVSTSDTVDVRDPRREERLFKAICQGSYHGEDFRLPMAARQRYAALCGELGLTRDGRPIITVQRLVRLLGPGARLRITARWVADEARKAHPARRSEVIAEAIGGMIAAALNDLWRFVMYGEDERAISEARLDDVRALVGEFFRVRVEKVARDAMEAALLRTLDPELGRLDTGFPADSFLQLAADRFYTLDALAKSRRHELLPPDLVKRLALPWVTVDDQEAIAREIANEVLLTEREIADIPPTMPTNRLLLIVRVLGPEAERLHRGIEQLTGTFPLLTDAYRRQIREERPGDYPGTVVQRIRAGAERAADLLKYRRSGPALR